MPGAYRSARYLVSWWASNQIRALVVDEDGWLAATVYYLPEVGFLLREQTRVVTLDNDREIKQSVQDLLSELGAE